MSDNDEAKPKRSMTLTGDDPRPLRAIKRLRAELRSRLGDEPSQGVRDAVFLDALKTSAAQEKLRVYGERPGNRADRVQIPFATFRDPEMSITREATIVRRGQILWDEVSLSEEDFLLLLSPEQPSAAETQGAVTEQEASNEAPPHPSYSETALAAWFLYREGTWPLGDRKPNREADYKAACKHFGVAKISPDEFRRIRTAKTSENWRKRGPRGARYNPIRPFTDKLADDSK